MVSRHGRGNGIGIGRLVLRPLALKGAVDTGWNRVDFASPSHRCAATDRRSGCDPAERTIATFCLAGISHSRDFLARAGRPSGLCVRQVRLAPGTRLENGATVR